MEILGCVLHVSSSGLYLHTLKRNTGNGSYHVPDCDSSVCSIIANESACTGNLELVSLLQFNLPFLVEGCCLVSLQLLSRPCALCNTY